MSNNIETEYKNICDKNEWPVLYQKIRSESIKESGTCVEALKPQNKNLNRYRDVNPYDHSRIKLQRGTTDYINANLVKVEKANRRYILTQGPLVNTVSHFWLMVWEQDSRAVLMLNKLMEKKQEKCYQYWPAKIGPEHIMRMDDVELTLEYLEQHDYSYYLTRLLKLTDLKTDTSREILQFHYTTWPDFGVPSSPVAFLEFLRKVRDAGVLESNVGPAVVHCSAGIGRSGTFCLVDSCLVLIEKYGFNSVDVKEVLFEMRRYRMGLIQTADQLRFSYQAIIEGAKRIYEPASIDAENHIEKSNNTSTAEGDTSGSDDDGPPPLPPPRLDSLNKRIMNGTPLDRPLPNIPNSTSLNDFNFTEEKPDEDIPSGPLPVAPADVDEQQSSEDELIDEEVDEEEEEEEGEEEMEDEGRVSENSSALDKSNTPQEKPSSPSEMRHRKRMEQKEKLEAKVKDMKRRQLANEQWTQLKRSLYNPLVIAGGIALGGGLILYLYFKN